jgi:hypothetical protein
LSYDNQNIFILQSTGCGESHQDINVAVEDSVEGKELAAAVVGGVDPGHEVVLLVSVS